MQQNEDTRLREFRQLKREIRGSTQHLVVGIDIAKDNHTAFCGTPTGKCLLRGFVFENTKEGFEKLIFQADTVKTRENCPHLVFGMEPTADYHKPLGEYLITRGCTVVLVAGTAVKNNRELLDGRWDKHDAKDAANVADLITQGKCLFYEFPPPDLKELRSLLSLKRRLKKSEQGYKVRIRNHLIAQYFPEMDAYFSYGEGPAIVKWCLDPGELANLPFEEFVRMVSSRNGGVPQRKRLMEIHARAASSIGCEIHRYVAFEATTLLEGLHQFHAGILETDRKIKEICKRLPEYSCLLSIPGFGPDVSAKVIGAIGNPHRFENHRQVLKLAGLDISKEQSGKYKGIPVISKRGKADLRYGLYQAAFIASTRNHRFMAYLDDRLKGRQREKGIFTNRRVKLAGKMLTIAWTLMKKKEVFNPDCIK